MKVEAMQNRVMRGILGGIIGAVAGVPVAFMLALLLIQTVVPTDYWNEDSLLPGLTLGLALPFVLTGAQHGAAPNRFSTVALRALKGFGIGFVLGALIALALAVAAAALFGISQREGAYAMSVAFVLVPLGGVILGTILAIRAVLKA